MKCPYCNQEMLLGNLYAPSGRAVFWLPSGTELDGWILTHKWIEDKKGFVLGDASKVGFIAKKRPESYYCPDCKIVISKEADETEI